MNILWISVRQMALPHSFVRLSTEQYAILLTSQVMALLWWGAVFALYAQHPDGFWGDQSKIFLQVVNYLDQPYTDYRFANPAWTAFFLAPQGLMSVPVAALIQIWVYFTALAVFIIRYAGTGRTALVVFTSYVALDSCWQLNLEWIVALGLLVPPRFALPFLLVKPQTALGVMLCYVTRPKILLQSGLVLMVLFAITIAIWEFWPTDWLDNARRVEDFSHNIAPAHVLPRLLSYLLGLPLVIRTIRHRDPLLGIIAWVFYVPYYTAYGALIWLTCVALKLKEQPVIVHIGLWLLAFVPGMVLIMSRGIG